MHRGARRKPRVEVLTVAQHCAAASAELALASIAARRAGDHVQGAQLDGIADELLAVAIDEVRAEGFRLLCGGRP